MSVSPDANHCLLLRSETKLSVHLILRSDAQHRVSKDGPRELRPIGAHWSALRGPSGRLRARSKEFLRTRRESR
jgi:hypothetical protein